VIETLASKQFHKQPPQGIKAAQLLICQKQIHQHQADDDISNTTDFLFIAEWLFFHSMWL